MGKGIFGKLALGLLIIVLAVEVVALFRPLPQPRTIHTRYTLPSAPATLPWPQQGQAALGTTDFGILDVSGQQKPVPIASVAKVITALAVLKQKPLADGQAGPTITLGPTDVAYYQSTIAKGGSAAQVVDGEQLSERQALEAMLLPSANNMAESLAQWAFGSLESFKTFSASYLKSLGLTHTIMTDPSGFDPSTTSNATDLIELAKIALSNPALASIVSEASANVPIAGSIDNTNLLVGTDGIVGIKTGDTDQAGGCFLFAATHLINGHNVTLIGAVLGAPNLSASMQQAQALIDAADANFDLVKVAKTGQSFGTFKSLWGNSLSAQAKSNLDILKWRSQKIPVSINLKFPASSTPKGTVIGNISAGSANQERNVSLITNTALPSPSLSWRLTHP